MLNILHGRIDENQSIPCARGMNKNNTYKESLYVGQTMYAEIQQKESYVAWCIQIQLISVSSTLSYHLKKYQASQSLASLASHCRRTSKMLTVHVQQPLRITRCNSLTRLTPATGQGLHARAAPHHALHAALQASF